MRLPRVRFTVRRMMGGVGAAMAPGRLRPPGAAAGQTFFMALTS